VRLEPGCVKIEKTQSLFLILANGERAIIAFLKEKLGVIYMACCLQLVKRTESSG
jgi:hypothetical protein